MSSIFQDLDYADDIPLVAHTHQYIQDKTNPLSKITKQIGPDINLSQSEIMNVDIGNQKAFKINDQKITETNIFTCLGDSLWRNKQRHKE